MAGNALVLAGGKVKPAVVLPMTWISVSLHCTSDKYTPTGSDQIRDAGIQSRSIALTQGVEAGNAACEVGAVYGGMHGVALQTSVAEPSGQFSRE